MSNTIHTTRKKRLFVIIFFLVLLVAQALVSEAQKNDTLRDTRIYRGFDVSFGTRIFKLNSDVVELNNVSARQSGGLIGFVAGNDIWRIRLGVLGYFSQTSDVSGAMDVYENSLSANFYPLNLSPKKKSRINPYLTGGLVSDRVKFHGYYADKDRTNVNYSSFDTPYLGSINTIRASVGTGVDITLVEDFDFVHLFSEVVYGFNLTQNSKSALFENTKLNNQLVINVGVRFGGHRYHSARKR